MRSVPYLRLGRQVQKGLKRGRDRTDILDVERGRKMKVEGTPKPQGTEARRFSAAKAAPKSAPGKSFGDILRKAAAPSAHGEAIGTTANAEVASLPATSAPEAVQRSAESAGKTAAPENQSATSDAFESHMDLVKLRLKAGYYSSSNMDEALSDKLTGYFDELA
jgi:hypothetical protein